MSGHVKGLSMKYFVLKPAGTDKYAQASRAALRRYAKVIGGENPELAAELMNWADKEFGEAVVAGMADDNSDCDEVDGLCFLESGYQHHAIMPLVEARVQAAIGDEKLNPWKQAIIEALVVDFILSKANENDPKKALADLIDWNTKLALDPRVSSNAAALEQAAAFEMRERCAAQAAQCAVEFSRSVLSLKGVKSTIRSLPIPTDALDAMLLRARTDGRIEQHRCERGCVQCSRGLRCHIVEGLRGILERDLAALAQPAPEVNGAKD